MHRFGKTALASVPWLVLLGYCIFIADYHRYLDSNLKYRRLPVAVAPEDVLGLGFWATWALILALLVIACGLVYRFATRSRRYFVAIAIIFAIASVTDFVLYRVLERQVLSL
jgi:hypothetical protein